MKTTLKKILSELKSRNNIRERMLTKTRKITHLSKQAIIALHQNKFGETEKRLSEARRLLDKLREEMKDAGELGSGSLSAAYEEYAEGMILLKLEREGVYPSQEEIGVPSSAYILGLGDVVGELRRKALDSIRVQKTEDAERYLRWMEEIYNELMLVDEHVFALLGGLRRKCDLARRLVEITRGDVVMEARRRHLEASLKHLEKKVKTKAAAHSQR